MVFSQQELCGDLTLTQHQGTTFAQRASVELLNLGLAEQGSREGAEKNPGR